MDNPVRHPDRPKTKDARHSSMGECSDEKGFVPAPYLPNAGKRMGGELIERLRATTDGSLRGCILRKCGAMITPATQSRQNNAYFDDPFNGHRLREFAVELIICWKFNNGIALGLSIQRTASSTGVSQLGLFTVSAITFLAITLASMPKSGFQPLFSDVETLLVLD
ncbi:predicted protein [Histoplasma mississippiense (nom. inval.)]|uniref:predicted protein n=1 Tax=Ajellomyces capsulatus (strain NAm1 / WU24) TaxID=2059318 RepID=UPI000157BDC3|nr:predicted protein [Histoplasma mississippiense (nom. inval.)]EDN06305.1 predicted protein [Histoplasma mississippiense (nom. inval.)]